MATDLREYERQKFAIADILRSASTIAQKNDRAWQERQRDLFARLADDRFSLVCVGRFSRGKSSLMNAILGTDRLPTGIVPLTSVITSVGYGTKEQVILQFHERIFTKEVPIEELPKYITQQGNPGNVQRIKVAEVQLRAEILRRGFYFVDTPGLGSAIEASTRMTEAFLPEADAFVLVTSYESPLSDEEMQFFRAASSSARRIFLVLNKQDTVSPGERTEVLRYVRDLLRPFYGDISPNIFSLSAREGLEAKQHADPKQLAASGIAELEEALLNFLLTEKTTEFLLRMCDRVTDLLRALPPSSTAKNLIEQIDILTKRFAQDRGDGRLAPYAAAAELPNLRQFAPCEVCSHVQNELWNFLCKFQYAITVDHDEQRRLAQSGGLCALHTWQYADVASPYGTCTGYPPLLHRLAASLREVSAAGLGPESLGAKIEALLPRQNRCALCRVRTEAESEAIAAVAKRLAEHETEALESLTAICLPHFAMVADVIRNPALIRKLMSHEATLLERLAEDMERSALKHDAVKRFLESKEESTAAGRTLLLLAGDRRVNADDPAPAELLTEAQRPQVVTLEGRGRP
jgi:small GTP-binding protein